MEELKGLFPFDWDRGTQSALNWYAMILFSFLQSRWVYIDSRNSSLKKKSLEPQNIFSYQINDFVK